MTKAGRLIAILAVFGIAAAVAYWIYLYIAEGSAPSFGDLWNSLQGGVTSVTGLGKLNFAAIQTYASNAGFQGNDLNTACAIALAESSGNPSAVGDLNITPGGSIGLWQINLKAHPEYTAAELNDPQTNANAAYVIYQAAGNSFSPWSTFNSGVYASYLPASLEQTASNGAPTQDSSATETTADNTGDVTGDTADMIGGSNV